MATYTRTVEDGRGNVISTSQHTTPPEFDNRADLQSKAAAALTANATYLAIASPTVAQNTAQVKALTREVNALIRLLTDRLDSTAGT